RGLVLARACGELDRVIEPDGDRLARHMVDRPGRKGSVAFSCFQPREDEMPTLRDDEIQTFSTEGGQPKLRARADADDTDADDSDSPASDSDSTDADSDPTDADADDTDAS